MSHTWSASDKQLQRHKRRVGTFVTRGRKMFLNGDIALQDSLLQVRAAPVSSAALEPVSAVPCRCAFEFTIAASKLCSRGRAASLAATSYLSIADVAGFIGRLCGNRMIACCRTKDGQTPCLSPPAGANCPAAVRDARLASRSSGAQGCGMERASQSHATPRQ